MTAAGLMPRQRDDAPPSSAGHERSGRATFSARHASATRVVVAVVGDVDAVNARALGRYVEQHVRLSKQLVLDMRAVDFVGTPAFTALYYISARCTRGDVDWTIVGSHAVRRLLAICDPERELPLADDLVSGLARLDRLAQCHCAPAG